MASSTNQRFSAAHALTEKLKIGADPKKSKPAKYIVAAGSVVLVTLLKVFLNKSFAGSTPFLLMFLPVIFSTWYGGFGAGVTALVLSTISVDYLFLAQASSVRATILWLSLYAIEGFASIAIGISLRNSVADVKKQEHYFRALIENSHDVIALVDTSGKLLYSSPSVKKILGVDAEALLGRDGFMLVHPEDQDLAKGNMAQLMAQPGSNSKTQVRIKRADGVYIWVEIISTNLLANPNVGGIVINFRDITEEKNAHSEHQNNEIKLSESRKQLETILEGVTDGITAQDPTGRLMYANKAAARLIGFDSVQDLLNAGSDEIMQSFTINNEDGEPMELAELPSRLALQGEQPEPMIIRFTPTNKNDERWSVTKSSPIFDQAGKVMMVVNIFRDITQRKTTEEILRFQASHDTLTGLPNRQALVESMADALAQAHSGGYQVALIFIDLDRFKNINDTLGHEVGDQMLQKIAKRLRTSVRQEDIVARLGGDEFIVLMPKVNEISDATKLARKLIKKLRPQIRIANYQLTTTASIGISIYPTDGDDVNGMLKNADVALYRAKEAGRNQYKMYSQTMNLKAAERLTLESSLRVAAAKNELVLSYQPIFDLRSNTVGDVEALIRWRHPKLGLLFPNEFIPIAEETGSIVSIGHWVLKNACKQILQWNRGASQSPQISINLSARQFAQPNLVQNISETIREFGIDPKRLGFEVTETVAMINIEETRAKLASLREMGSHIIIDDFGTGYSSLGYLKRFPLNKLKIDQSFVRNCITDESDAAIIQAIISMAHSLKLAVIAEGVETQEQLDFLVARGCDYVQGFLFSKPMPAEDVPNWITNFNLSRQQSADPQNKRQPIEELPK